MGKQRGGDVYLKLIPRVTPLNTGVALGVRGHTQNQTNGMPGRGGGVRKTYKTQNKKTPCK